MARAARCVALWTISGVAMAIAMAAFTGCGRTDATGDSNRMTDRAPTESSPARTVLLVIGDSLTAGFGLELNAQQAYPALLQERFDHEGLAVEVVNGGESGRTTSGGVSALDWYLKRRVDVAVIALGGNDALRGVEVSVVEQNLLRMIDAIRAKYPACKLILAGMAAPTSMGKVYCDAFAAVFPKVAKERSVALVPFLLEGVAADKSLNQADGIHPTAAGQKILAANVWPAVLGAVKTIAH